MIDPGYLAPSEVVDFQDAQLARLAEKLCASDASATAARCFAWVRDNILHSGDHQRNPVTCRASSVLAHRTGYCYAKSHLFVGLLRANGIPAGFCYQRLSAAGDGPPYCLHGLAAVWLADFGWYRCDPRGQKPGVDAQFCPPEERLPFAASGPGEFDVPGVHAAPLACVVDALMSHATWDGLTKHLPDAPAELCG